jgi:hypothetical protein
MNEAGSTADLNCSSESLIEEAELHEDLNKALPVSGRRIVDLNYFLKQIQSVDHSPFKCSFSDMLLVGERRLGLRTCLNFVCKVCNAKENIWTEDSKNIDINLAAVSGVMSSGGGYSQLDEIFSAMDIPFMAEKTYRKHHESVCEGWEISAVKEMEAAAKIEAEKAVESGDVDKDGVPLITVIADGSWCKRSYRSNYSSLGGVVSINFLIY